MHAPVIDYKKRILYYCLNIHAGCNVNAATCEVWVDVYLDYFCAQAISDSMMNSSAISTSATIATELPCPTSTITIHAAHLTTKTGTQCLYSPCMHAMLGSASAVHTIDYKQASMTYTPTQFVNHPI